MKIWSLISNYGPCWVNGEEKIFNQNIIPQGIPTWYILDSCAKCHHFSLDTLGMKKKKKRIMVQFSHSVMSDSLLPHGLQQARFCCPSPTPRICSNSHPLSWWCHATISSSVVPFSCLQPFPASGSFLVSQFFASGGQSIGVSASALVLPMNIQEWFPLGLIGLISLLSQGLSRVFSNTTVQNGYRWATL